MVGAEQLVTLILSWFRPGAVRPAVMCSGHYIVLHRGAHRGGLQARWERRSGLQVPEVLIEAVRVFAIRRPPVTRGLPLLLRPRRKQFTSVPYYFAYV
jgi:hypothetical protein